MGELLIIGLVSALNLIILKIKIDLKRYADSALDLTLFVMFMMFSGGTLGGIIIATIGSLVISIFLYFSPPRLIKVKT